MLLKIVIFTQFYNVKNNLVTLKGEYSESIPLIRKWAYNVIYEAILLLCTVGRRTNNRVYHIAKSLKTH